MPQFVTGTFNPGVTPQAFNPVTPALQAMLNMQKTRQAGMQTQFMHPLLQQKLAQQIQESRQAEEKTKLYPLILAAQSQSGSPFSRFAISELQKLLPKQFGQYKQPTQPSAQGNQPGGLLSGIEHGAHALANYFSPTSHTAVNAQQFQTQPGAQFPTQNLQAAQAQPQGQPQPSAPDLSTSGYKLVNVKGQKVWYNPVTKEMKGA